MPRYIRDLFTGEWKEVDFDPGVFHRESSPKSDGFLPTYGLKGGKKWQSNALAVHPADVPRLNTELHEHGISGNYRPDGVFETSSSRARREECRRRGVKDLDGCYSDPC